jgi:uncharacterized membrane protein YfcA
MKKTWRPTVAGIINIAFGLPLALGLTWVVIDYLLDSPRLVAMGLAPILIPLSLIATFSGWLYLYRRWWWLVLFTSVLGIPAGGCSFAFLASLIPPDTFSLTVPVYPFLLFVALMAPMVLIGVSRREFGKRDVVMEMLREA